VSLFTVDKSICKKDGSCARVCPVGIIGLDAQGFPVPVEGAGERCIDCGHCVAVCPHGALALGSMSPGQCARLPGGWNLSVPQVEYLLKGRRSIRVFKKDVVDRAVIEYMIDIARYAPSGINQQPVRWAVLHDAEKVRKLAQETISWMKSLIAEKSPMAESFKFANLVSGWEQGRDFICREAPHMVFTYALKDDMIAPGACTIAGSYFELAALPHGVGTCWAGYAQMAVNRWPAAQDIVNISKKCACFGAFLVGYPRYAYSRIPLRNPPKILWR
jgi:nitroreductase/NAD-dependent dihydropyrimidine dehydrogenase PreA subunit